MKRIFSLGAALAVAACATVPAPVISLDGLPAAFAMSGRIAIRHGAGRARSHGCAGSGASRSDVWVLATPVGTEWPGSSAAPRASSCIDRAPRRLPPPVSRRPPNTCWEPALDERLLVAWLHRRPVAGPDGWEVTIDESQRLGGHEVARRITASRGDTVVKLVVDDYEVRPE